MLKGFGLGLIHIRQTSSGRSPGVQVSLLQSTVGRLVFVAGE
jgi:hypothetical protein